MNRDEALRILGLNSGATVDEARRAYREQVKLWHPDRYSNNSALKSLALKNAQDANRAWAYLRPRLPRSKPRGKPSVARSQPGRVPRSSGKIILSERLRQGVLKMAPLIARIRRLPLDAITGWLRDDPNRNYRPWYRYASKNGHGTAKGRKPTFGQTLAEVMQTRSSGSLPHTPKPDRKIKAQRAVSPSPSNKKIDRHGGGIGAVDPVDRSRRT